MIAAGGSVALLLAVLSLPAAPHAASAPDAAAGVVSGLLERLTRPDERRDAREALLELGPEAVPALLGSFEHPEFVVRWELVNHFGLRPDARAVPLLVERAVEDENPHVRWRALWALAAQPETRSARETLHARMADPGDRVAAWNAAVGLSMLGDERCRPALHAGLRDPDGWRRWEAVHALGRVGDASSVPHVAALLQDESVRHRREAALVLGRLGGPQAAAALRGALADESPEVRWRAALSLGRIGPREAAGWLAPLLEDPDPMVREKALQARLALRAAPSAP